jgi:hypothetical protein
MAKYRHATLYPSTSCATAGTLTVDLDVVDPISKIQVIQKVTSAGTEKTAHPAADVSKIELVDGSDVLVSLTGKECQALDFYNSKYSPDTFYSDDATIMSFATFNLNFGRKLWDPALALDPSKFRNPQLKITHNIATADASATVGTLEVYAHMFDAKKISPVGFLSGKEQKTYLTGASGTIEQSDLPKDAILRQLLVFGRGATYLPWQVANHIKLLENGGKSVPYDFQTTAWLKFINQCYPMAHEKFIMSNAGSARHLFCAPSFTDNVAIVGVEADHIIYRPTPNEAPPLHIAAAGADVLMGDVMGWNPHGAFPIPFGVQDDLDDWYDPSGLTTLKLEITAGTGGATGYVDIVTEQLRKY